MSDEYLDFAEADLGAIMAAGNFDQSMIFLAEDGGQIPFRGIFSAPTEEQNPGGSTTPATAQNYTVAYKETDLPRRLKRDDRLQARGEIWRVYKAHSDGQGLLTVSIQKAKA